MRKDRIHLVTATALGEHLGITRQRVSALVVEGVFKQNADRRMDQDACRLAYIAWLRGEKAAKTNTAAVSRVQDARARDIEMRIAERERVLIHIDEAFSVLDEMAGMLKTGFAGIGARVTSNLDLRDAIEAEHDKVFGQVANLMGKRAAEMRAERKT